MIYLLIDPPVSSFLNEIFIKLDDVWGKNLLVICLFVLFRWAIYLILLSFTWRASGHCCICIFLLLPSTCCNCWSNDAWSETGFYNNPPNEVSYLFASFPIFSFIFPSIWFHFFKKVDLWDYILLSDNWTFFADGELHLWTHSFLMWASFFYPQSGNHCWCSDSFQKYNLAFLCTC